MAAWPWPCRMTPALAEDYLDHLDGLIVTGGAFDVDPALYGDTERHETVELKEDRTTAELALLQRRADAQHAGAGHLRRAAAARRGAGRHAAPAYSGRHADALEHEQKTSHYEPGHEVKILAGTRLYDIAGATMQVNTSHHQAVRDAGRGVVNAIAPDGVIEGLEDPTQKFCIGVQWHPEYFVDAGDAALYRGLHGGLP